MEDKSYLETVLQGRFEGIMDLKVCDDLLSYLVAHPSDWFIYDLDARVPETPCEAVEFTTQITIIKEIIATKHTQRYCGIVYADSTQSPTIVKIFHPDNVGKSCGSSETPPLPKWIISKIAPVTIEVAKPKSSRFRSFFSL